MPRDINVSDERDTDTADGLAPSDIARRPPLALLPRLCLRAVFELGLARIRHRRWSTRRILAPLAPARTTEERPIAAWVAYLLPNVARFMPFRSDCLVQAMAGQRWLASCGLESRIVIGSRENPEPKAELDAHAWLLHCGIPVTGGNVHSYSEIISTFD